MLLWKLAADVIDTVLTLQKAMSGHDHGDFLTRHPANMVTLSKRSFTLVMNRLCHFWCWRASQSSAWEHPLHETTNRVRYTFMNLLAIHSWTSVQHQNYIVLCNGCMITWTAFTTAQNACRWSAQVMFSRCYNNACAWFEATKFLFIVHMHDVETVFGITVYKNRQASS